MKKSPSGLTHRENIKITEMFLTIGKNLFKLCPTEVVSSAWPSYCYHIQHDTTLVLLYIVPLYTSLVLSIATTHHEASLWALLTMRSPYFHCAHHESSLWLLLTMRPPYCHCTHHETSLLPLYSLWYLPIAIVLTMRPPYCHCAHYETSLLPLYSPWDLSIATVLTMRPPYCHCTHHDTSLLPLYSPWDLPIATVLTMIPLYCQWCRWVRWCWSDNRSSPWTKNTLELE